MEVATGEHDVVRLCAEIRAAADDLGDAASSAWSLHPTQVATALVAVTEVTRSLEASRLALIRTMAAVDVRETGATSVAGLLQWRCLSAPGRARSDVAAARATDPHASPTAGAAGSDAGALVGMGTALAEGRVSRAHVDVAVKVLEKVPTRMRAAAGRIVDDFLVDVSQKYPPRECENLAAQLLDRLDPDRADRAFDPDAFARRRFDMVTDSTGMLVVRGQLDPMTGARLKAAVEHLSAPDAALEAETEDGRAVVVRDERTPSQRRADALGLLASRARAGSGSSDAAARVVVHTTVEQLTALASGDQADRHAAGRAWCEQTGFVTPDVLERLGCSAVFQRVLFAPGGAVLGLGRSARLASPAQRRALAARDRGCVAPGCTRPASQTDAHHVVPWSRGGRTDVDQLVLLCGVHHQAVHAGVLDIVMREGVPWVRLPAWVDADRPLVRNTLHDEAAGARARGTQLRLDVEAVARPDPIHPRPREQAPGGVVASERLPRPRDGLGGDRSGTPRPAA